MYVQKREWMAWDLSVQLQMPSLKEWVGGFPKRLFSHRHGILSAGGPIFLDDSFSLETSDDPLHVLHADSVTHSVTNQPKITYAKHPYNVSAVSS